MTDDAKKYVEEAKELLTYILKNTKDQEQVLINVSLARNRLIDALNEID